MLSHNILKIKFIKLKKYVVCVFSILFLTMCLYLSQNYENFASYFSKYYTINVYSATKTAQSSTNTTKSYSGNDMTELLARLINGEARGETYLGQVAVGAVVLNRVKSPLFPNTISGVIYQKSQFSCVTDGQFNKPIDKNSTIYKAAKEAMSGSDPTNGALYFYNPRTAKSKWLFSLKTVATIGSHRFAIGG